MRSIRRLAFVLLAFVMYSKAQGQALAIYLSEDATYRYVNASAATSIPSVPSDWADFGFDDSAWHVGQGAFGSSFGGSLGNTTGPQTPNAPTFTGSTPWSTNWDPYLRTTFTLAAPTNLTIWIAVDNGINSIHLNGVQATATFNAEGTANRWEHVLDVPAAYTQTGTNVIALQAEDHGGGTGFAMVVTEDDLAIHTQFTTNSPAFPSFDAPTPCGQIVPVSNGIPVAISFSASDPQPSQLLTLTAAGVPAGAVFSPPLPVVGTSPSTTLTWTPGFTMPTAHTMTMTVIDETGLSNQCQVVLDEVPYVDLGVVPGSLITNPVAPLVGQSTLVEVSVANSGYVTAQAEVSLYDGNPDFGGQLIGQQTGPIAFGTMTTFAVSWTPNTAGSHGLFAVVDNLSQTDNNLADNRASVSVNVGTPPDQLTVEAGEVAAWPGATVSTVVTIRNSGSAPATISGASTTSSWATLTNPPSGVLLAPGATYTLLVDVAVPIGTSGATMGSAPIGYTILVAATTATSTFSDGILVNVFDQPVSQVTVRVEDLATVAPLAGSLVTIEGVPGQLVTDSAGEVTVDLPEGLRGFFAYHSGYTAAAVNEVVVAGSSLVTIALEPGQTLAITNITQSPPLTTAQINAAGINVSDPVNNVVVNFTVALQIGTVVTPYVEIPMNPPPGSSYSFSGTAVATGAPSLPGGSVSFSATINQTPYGPQETWIIIPGAVTALKQFFEVSMYLVNNAVAPVPSDVQVQGLDATLGLPAGLGLPDLDGQPQSLTQYLGTLDAGSSTQATWIIRGDEPGTYLLSGSSSGDLHAFGMFSNTLNATATGRPFDVVLPRLRLDFITPQAVTAGVQFMPDFGVLVTNEGVATANLVRVSLKVDQLINCHPCLTQPSGTTAVVDGMGDIIELIAVLGDIEPGQSGLAEFCLIAEVTGQVINVETSIWSSATPSPSVTVSPSYPGNDQSCAIYSGIGEPPNAVALNVGYPGQLGEVLIDAPTHVGGSLVLAAGVYYEGIQPAEVFPGIWVGAGLAVVTLPPVAVHPQGNHFFFDVVPGYRDFSFLLQGVIVSPATPASYCATAAHEFRVRQ